jgi:SAM-dependent methyltransferase
MPGVEEALERRDTDADWRELGVSNPYWGVISQPRYLKENVTPEGIEEFYESGRQQIDALAADLAWLTGKAPSGRALDFGCGVGRLAEAMTRYAQQVTGYDISPGMLEIARARGGRVKYVGEMPDGPFDWINSFIVFQHIPPERGLDLFGQLLARLAVDGVISLQVAVWREHGEAWPQETGLKRLFQKPRQHFWARRLPVGQILMYDYDMSKVIRLLNEAGIEDMRLLSTDHGGHHGVVIMGRKAARPASVSRTS